MHLFPKSLFFINLSRGLSRLLLDFCRLSLLIVVLLFFFLLLLCFRLIAGLNSGGGHGPLCQLNADPIIAGLE